MSVRANSLFPAFEQPAHRILPGPRLGILWQNRRSNVWDNVWALVAGPKTPKEFQEGENFRDCHVKSRTPRGSFVTSVIWHAALVAFLIEFGAVIFTGGPTTGTHNLEIAWSGPINDLPLIAPAEHVKLPAPPRDPAKPVPQRGADAYHPTQTLISAPKIVTHPHQTLVRPDSPQVAPKILPSLPNIVVWNTAPEDPRRKIAADKLLEKPELKTPSNAKVAELELPNEEKKLAEMNFADVPDPERPKLTLPAGRASVSAPTQTAHAASSAAPAPEIAATTGNQQIIALSATPGPPAPSAPVPSGNLAANVSISPDGKRPGTPGGAENGAAGNSGGSGANGISAGNLRGPVVGGISVSGGDPSHSPGVSGVGNSNGERFKPGSVRVAPGTVARSSVSAEDASKIPIAERIKPGSPPEHIFNGRTVYTLNVNMPNISSVTGSWVLKFAALDDNGESQHPPIGVPAKQAPPLAGLEALHKVDPSFPPEQVMAHIQGEVVLYAIIREDGSVDSIQVAKPLDPVLDKNAMEALAGWKFSPAKRNGVPVALESLVHIPFYSVRHDY
jgi:TonB family protein